MSTDLKTIRSILRSTPDRWWSLAREVPEALLTRSPGAGNWSALACLQHMIDVERLLQSRMNAFLRGDESFPAFNPDSEGSQLGETPEIHSLVAEFAALRLASLDAIEKLHPDDLRRRCRHAELGMVSLEQMLNEWPAHDLNHTVQAERALMQPFIQDCGPWSQYFTDHIIKPGS